MAAIEVTDMILDVGAAPAENSLRNVELIPVTSEIHAQVLEPVETWDRPFCRY